MFTITPEPTPLINTNNLINIDSPLINTNNSNNSQSSKIYNKIHVTNENPKFVNNAMTLNTLDKMLEKEKNFNKTDSWNKLDKTIKTQKLYIFAEKYGKDNNLSLKDIKLLKIFLSDSLEKGKFQKTKQILYNKNTNEITSIPSLFFNTTTHNYTVKNTDPKRVSALKSLTPKRIHNISENNVLRVADVDLII